MVFYFKSNISSKYIQPLIHRYISMELNSYTNSSLDTYLKNNYNINLKSVIDSINFYCRVTDFKDNVLSIYWNNNIIIENNDLNTIMQLLEYGNLDIPPLKLISGSFTNIIKSIKNRLV